MLLTLQSPSPSPVSDNKFLLNILKPGNSLTFLAFENEAEKCMEATLSTLLQRLVVSDSCLYLLTLFDKIKLYP